MIWQQPTIRTGFSFRAAAGNIDDVLNRLEELEQTTVPITDRVSTFGFSAWRKAAEKRGMRAVYGVEIAVSPDANEKKPVFDYWTFYATDSLRPIHDLIDNATFQFRYQPLLEEWQAIEFARQYPAITGNRVRIDSDELEEWPEFLRVGITPATPVHIVRRALARDLPIIAASDNLYCTPDDRSFYTTLAGRNSNTHHFPQHILSEAEWRVAVEHHAIPPARLGEALAAGGALLDLCHAAPIKATLPEPPRPATLQAMCETGAAALGVDLVAPVYAERLERELRVIHEKNFDDYFYIVADLCQWARKEMVVGPARGSSAGSLVCYLLGITTIDPLKFDLIFERFIDINRMDDPDIDIDFSDQSRHKVFKYVADKYGADHVARLGTVNMFQARSALDETAGAFRMPKWALDPIKENLVERPLGDPRATMTIHDTFNEKSVAKKFIEKTPGFRIAERLEGHPRHSGQHAAAVVISRQPILDIVAVDFRVEDKNAKAMGTTLCAKDDAEKDYGLLKIDALGLTELSVFEECMKQAGLEKGFLEKLPLDDTLAFEVLNSHSFNGVFQWGPAVQGLSKQIVISDFSDIVALNALARPGPLKSGSAETWIRRKNGARVEYPHAAFEPILKETLGVIIYQEQVMRIARDVGRMTWERVTEMRKAISKSKGRAALATFEAEFMSGAKASGVPDDIAAAIWSEMLEHGAYSFNKSHAVAYAMVAYWGCWLKAHYPVEFAAASLTHRPDDKSRIALLREMRDLGLEYVPVDPEHSTDKWTVLKSGNSKKLLGPLSTIKGMGPKRVAEVLSHRERPNEPLSAAIRKMLANPTTTIDSLSPIEDRIKVLHPDRLASGLVSEPKPIGNVQENDDGKLVVWARVDRITEKDENGPDAVERRGYAHKSGPLRGLSLMISDDTGEMFAKIGRFEFEKLGRVILERGRPGKALYALAGTTFKGARVLMVEKARYLGDMEKDTAPVPPPAPDPGGEDNPVPPLPVDQGELALD